MANLIVDLSNLVHASKWAIIKNGEFSEAHIMHKVIADIFSAAHKFDIDGILIACDGSHNWRKKIYPDYKGNREPDEYAGRLKEVMIALQQFFNECTSIPAIGVDGAEADDIIAIATQITKHDCVILSGDKDFIQLLDGSHVRLYSPTLQIERTSDNPAYDLFEKCIRGDSGDNIFSAYPRVRATKLQAAWNDKIAMLNLMETTLPDGRLVKTAYEFNQELIDLTRQPAQLKVSIKSAINNGVDNVQTYNFVHVLKFLGKWNMKILVSSINENSSFLKMPFIIK